MRAELPASIEKLLWDADPRSLNVEAHEQLIIERAINYGTLADWRWLVTHYGARAVLAALKMRGISGRSAIRSEARELASLIIR